MLCCASEEQQQLTIALKIKITKYKFHYANQAVKFASKKSQVF